jgi:hypothetical protein
MIHNTAKDNCYTDLKQLLSEVVPRRPQDDILHLACLPISWQQVSHFWWHEAPQVLRLLVGWDGVQLGGDTLENRIEIRQMSLY